MKKRNIIFILLLSLMLVCVACGDNNSGNNTEATTLLAEEPPVYEAKPYEKGVLTETGFESAWMGLSWQLPLDMKMRTEEELDEMLKQSLDIVYADKAEEEIDYSELDYVNEMLAFTPSSETTIPTILVMTEKLKDAEMTETEYIEVLTESLNSTGLGTYTAGGINAELIGGKYFTTVVYNSMTDYSQLILKYCLCKQDDRMIIVIISCVSEQDYLYLQNCFTMM